VQISGIQFQNVNSTHENGLLQLEAGYLWVDHVIFNETKASGGIRIAGALRQTEFRFLEVYNLNSVWQGGDLGVVQFSFKNSNEPACLVIEDSVFKHTRFRLHPQVTLFFSRCLFEASVTDNTQGLDTDGNLSLTDCTFIGHSIGVEIAASSGTSFKACGTNFTDCITAVVARTQNVSCANCYFTGITETGLSTQGSEILLKVVHCCFQIQGAAKCIVGTSVGSAEIEASVFNGQVSVGVLVTGSFRIDGVSCFTQNLTNGLAMTGPALTDPKVSVPTEIFEKSDCINNFVLGNTTSCEGAGFFYPPPTRIPPFNVVETTATANPNLSPKETEAVSLPPTNAQTTNPSSGGGETTSPSSGGGETTSPSSGGGETTSPSSGGGETTSPSSGGGETTSPSSGGGETLSPSSGGRETSVTSTGIGETASPIQSPTSGGGVRVYTRSPSALATAGEALAAQGSTSSAVIGGAVAGGLAGLAALAGLIGFILFKRKKDAFEVNEGILPQTLDASPEDNERYVSEYGLSDGQLNEGDEPTGDKQRRSTGRQSGTNMGVDLNEP
jgi:hypothetical protein